MYRIFEILLSILGLLALSPLFLVIALLIKVQDGGAVLYKARRMGRAGKEFRLFKFRTMIQGADQIGAGLTTRGDTRVTPLGEWLRRWKLDELPQLFNVLRGEMSFVGPRPEDPRYVATYSTEQRVLLDLRPGITSPASIAYRDESTLLAGDRWEQVYIEQILPHKLSIELEYLRHKSIWNDLRLVVRTLGGIVK